MPTVKFELDKDALERLQDLAHRERRYVPQQAEVLLLKALGLWSAQGVAEAESLHGPQGSGAAACRS